MLEDRDGDDKGPFSSINMVNTERGYWFGEDERKTGVWIDEDGVKRKTVVVTRECWIGVSDDWEEDLFKELELWENSSAW